jgi:hypothetical protein
LVTVGSSYVLNYFTTADSLPKFRAITVSSTTPSIGAELAYAGGTIATRHHSYAQSATVLLHFSVTSATSIFVFPITVSGTTLTAGTQATVATDVNIFTTGQLSNSRYALCFSNAGVGKGAVVSVAGSVASISTAAPTITYGGAFESMMQVFGNQAIVLTAKTSGSAINVITDTSGVATLGTSLFSPLAGSFVGYLSTSKVFLGSTNNPGSYYQYGISSGSAVLEKTFSLSYATATTGNIAGAAYSYPLSGPRQSGSGFNPIALGTSTGKLALSNTTLPFLASIDGTNSAKLQQTANTFISFDDAISDAVAFGIAKSQSATTTTVELKKVTLT